MASASPLDEAARRVRSGGLVAFPTETLWGLGADARCEGALARLRAWKGRGAAQPISILVEDAAALPPLGIALGTAAAALAAAFWPGPLTLVLPSRGGFAAGIANAEGGVGVRCSPHPAARALAARLAREGVGPLTATSLNRSGAPPARTREEARALCAAGEEGPWLFDPPGAPEPAGLASSVVDASGDGVRLLREGAIAADALRAALARVNLRLEERPA